MPEGTDRHTEEERVNFFASEDVEEEQAVDGVKDKGREGKALGGGGGGSAARSIPTKQTDRHTTRERLSRATGVPSQD